MAAAVCRACVRGQHDEDKHPTMSLKLCGAARLKASSTTTACLCTRLPVHIPELLCAATMARQAAVGRARWARCPAITPTTPPRPARKSHMPALPITIPSPPSTSVVVKSQQADSHLSTARARARVWQSSSSQTEDNHASTGALSTESCWSHALACIVMLRPFDMQLRHPPPLSQAQRAFSSRSSAFVASPIATRRVAAMAAVSAGCCRRSRVVMLLLWMHVSCVAAGLLL